jgi:hypothetical protein
MRKNSPHRPVTSKNGVSSIFKKWNRVGDKYIHTNGRKCPNCSKVIADTDKTHIKTCNPPKISINLNEPLAKDLPVKKTKKFWMRRLKRNFTQK